MSEQSTTQTSNQKAKNNNNRYIYQDRFLNKSISRDTNCDVSIVSNPSPAYIRVQKLTVKLNAMLSNPELSTIITWLPHGRSWKILKQKEFVSTVMPNYFESNNYKSFLRLLNAWGFRKITRGPEKNSFFHEVSE